MPVHTRRMYFHAQAVGFGGIIGKTKSKPTEVLIDSLAVSALSGAGGRHSQVATKDNIPQDLRRWVEFDKISVRTEGRFSDSKAVFQISESKDKSLDESKFATVTTSEVIIENLSILGGIFRAGLVKATIVARWPKPSDDNPIFIETPTFEKITVRDKPVEVLVDQNLLGATTVGKLGDAHKKCSDGFFRPKGDFGAKVADALTIGPHRNEDDAVHYTFVSQLKGENVGISREQPNRLNIKDFGQVFFGEVIARKNSRRVALLRFSLGSEEGANLESGTMEKNGSWSP